MTRILLSLTVSFALGGIAVPVAAEEDFGFFNGYQISQAVYSMTTIKVHAGKGDEYLEGLRQTWAATQEIAKDLGHIEDYRIYTSDLPDMGHFNMLLVVKMSSGSSLDPSKKRYDAFRKAFSKAKRDAVEETAKSYPELRTIAGEYLMRELTFD